MLLFWRHGYEGASLKQLTAAMGVTPPSLYAAFGDKKRLFLEALEHYLRRAEATQTTAPEGATARETARLWLEGAAIRATGDDTPPGCLVASAAISGSADSADVQAALARLRQQGEAYLREHILRDRDAGDLPPDTDAEALAGHVMSVVQGLSTLARDGASRERLLRVVQVAMAAWPSRATTAFDLGRHHGTSPAP